MLERIAETAPPTTVDDTETRGCSLLPLRVEELTYGRGGQRLIKGIDLELGDNGVTVVMGPNGAGKSILLKLLHGLVTPASGQILWNGVQMSDAIRKRQAMMFQRPVLLRRSVSSNVDFALRLVGVPDPLRRDELLSLVGLVNRSAQPARLLSGGEQQRLALARALATNPEVLLLDEPTANLDPASVLVIEDIVRKAGDNGTKVIFVTHDVAQARRLADDIIFVDRGRIAEHNEAARFFEQPATEAAEAYIEGRIVL